MTVGFVLWLLYLVGMMVIMTRRIVNETEIPVGRFSRSGGSFVDWVHPFGNVMGAPKEGLQWLIVVGVAHGVLETVPLLLVVLGRR